jgi:hypothetical protein
VDERVILLARCSWPLHSNGQIVKHPIKSAQQGRCTVTPPRRDRSTVATVSGRCLDVT